MYNLTKRVAIKASADDPGKKKIVTTANMGGYNGSGAGSMSVSSIGSGLLNNLDTLMVGIMPEDEQSLYRYYKDIYNYDVVGGSAVDLMSTLPFSEFTLVGGTDKQQEFFWSNLNNINCQTLLPDIAIEYLSLGKFTGTLLYDRTKREFTDVLPHNPEHITLIDTPLYGADPQLVMKVSDDMRRFLSSTDPYFAKIKKRIPENMIKEMANSQSVTLDPLSTIYLPRKNGTRSHGVSIYKRLLPVYLLEKIMYRGTITEANKRQRATTQIKMGSEYWEPQDVDLQMMVNLLQQSELDPLGAIIATRMDVDISEIRAAGDFWKYTDIIDITQGLKFKALGISEAFLSGESNWNAADTALSVFLEQLTAFRDFFTNKLFYDKLFPLTAVTNELKSQSKSRLLAKSITEVQREKEHLLIPEVHWHKQLRPRADREYLDVLNTMAEHGVPVTIRAWAAAGGLSVERLLTELKGDIKLRADIAKLVGQIKTPDDSGEGEGEGGYENEGYQEESSVATLIAGLMQRRKKPKSLLARDFGTASEVSDYTKTGKKKHVIHQARYNQKANIVIAKSLKRLSDVENYQKALAKGGRLKNL